MLDGEGWLGVERGGEVEKKKGMTIERLIDVQWIGQGHTWCMAHYTHTAWHTHYIQTLHGTPDGSKHEDGTMIEYVADQRKMASYNSHHTMQVCT